MPHVDDGTLNAYLDGELPPPEARSVETHVAQCPECRARVAEERGLIARAAELLARAAPPERDLPPLRRGDPKRPAPLWWQVRLPLAWAATVALALGVGAYLGPRLSPSSSAPDARLESTPAARIAQPAAQTARAPAQDALQVPRRDADRPPATKAALPAPSVTAAASSAPVARAEKRRVAPEAAALGHPSRSPIGLDSARILLGADPLAVAGVPVRGIYTARETGFSALVIVEQVLDSATTIDVMNGRRAPGALSDAVETGSGVTPGAARVPDDLRLEVQGPLSPDSLTALRRRLRPLHP